MKTVTALLVLGGLLPGTAQASSILVLAQSTDDPSFVTLGASPASPSIMAAKAAEPGKNPSIIALGSAEPGVAYENVAAIGEAQKSRPNAVPTVIRGGVTGEAFARGTGVTSAPAPAVPSAGTPEPAPTATPSAAAPSRMQPAPAQQAQPEGAPAKVE